MNTCRNCKFFLDSGHVLVVSPRRKTPAVAKDGLCRLTLDEVNNDDDTCEKFEIAKQIGEVK
jgi:hypothetical protein